MQKREIENSNNEKSKIDLKCNSEQLRNVILSVRFKKKFF